MEYQLLGGCSPGRRRGCTLADRHRNRAWVCSGLPTKETPVWRIVDEIRRVYTNPRPPGRWCNAQNRVDE
jgi:hypothetical protein